MSSNILFLKTKKHDYFYDGNTGNIMRITPAVKKILCEQNAIADQELLHIEYSTEEIAQALEQISNAKEKGLLSEQPEGLFYDLMLKQVPYTLENSLSGICLCVTQECNLRCEYCTFSGIYGNQNRNHSNQEMSFDTAKKAIDYTITRSGNWEEYHLSFYGGEPLIRFDFIKDCIEYVTHEYPGKKLDINITTNGTLLTPEKLDFLARHEVRLYISIDGPEEYHDEYRKYHNHRGSFKDIKNNLQYIREMYPDYYYKRVNFGVTLSPYRSVEKIEEFLAKDEMFYPESYIRLTWVSGGYEVDIYADKRNEKTQEESYIEHMFVNLRYLVSKTRGSNDYLHKTRVAETFCKTVNVSDRRKVPAARQILPGGPCTPGNRLFVTAPGEYVICEKAGETGCLKIGNVDEGVDVEKAQKILRDYFDLTIEECLKCWAFLNCSICPVQVEKDGKLSREEKLKQCEYVRRRLAYELTLYLAILEKNPLAFGAI